MTWFILYRFKNICSDDKISHALNSMEYRISMPGFVGQDGDDILWKVIHNYYKCRVLL